MEPKPNSLFYGDCLEVMRGWPGGFVDLCYLDPPFNSKAHYNILFGNRSGRGRQQALAFEDTWSWDDAAMDRLDAFRRAEGSRARTVVLGLYAVLGDSGMMAYLSYMAERLVEIGRVLKKSGSVYLHCDPAASHYLKVVMDAIFGQRNFCNEIIWSYQRWTGATRRFQRMHDTILFYAKDYKSIAFNMAMEPYSDKSKHRARRISAQTDSGLEQTYTGDTSRMKAMRDVWEISYINSQSKERLGYPTQKPLALLERIVRASSSARGTVLDPFCGCGTTIDAADRLGRRWLGIDMSPFAIDLIKDRRLRNKDIPVGGVPVDVETARLMARSKPLDFEKWAATRIPGVMPNARQTGDRGVDGRGHILDARGKSRGLVIVQVKGGKFSLSQFRDFLYAMSREGAEIGIYITLDRVTSRGAAGEARNAGYLVRGAARYPRAQLWSIADYFDGRLPELPPLADPFTGKAMQRDILAH